VELYYYKRTSETFCKVLGGTLQSTHAVSGKDDSVVQLKPMPTGSRPLGRFEPSPADPPPRPV